MYRLNLMFMPNVTKVLLYLHNDTGMYTFCYQYLVIGFDLL